MRMKTSPANHRKIAALVVVVVMVSFVIVMYNNQNQMYKFQHTYDKYTSDSSEYVIAMIADMDVNSKLESGDGWKSVLKKGRLSRDDGGKYHATFGDDLEIVSPYNEKGRGMELSELVHFDGRLLACDDRTGIVFEIKNDDVFPRYIFTQGDGDDSKGLKCEWMTVKDDKLYVGSIGKEWTTKEGVFIHNKLLWVKIVDTAGKVISEDWTDKYKSVKKILGITDPGYVVHEAINWDPDTRNWVFLPRRVTLDPYDAETEETKGSNYIVYADEAFSNFDVKRIGNLIPTHGFSSFKFIPHRHNEIVALKSVEHGKLIETYITVFDVETAEVLLEETKIGNIKFEGIEIL
eukprot:TRINITY_DN7047_c0_g2_i1.p1 TRINITY_DN7047_c0_g2~~TRINITY_DN7047_c0_g2_i1.p1  ORF type:complete len:348 (+),score=81.94 TRINITY_DN7047_c0_g2_i1:31-1074(+)